MNVHEYQAKQLLRQYGVPVAQGAAAFSADEAVAAAQALPGPVWVVKAQIHAGGRGKGKFKEPEAGDKGGVRLAKSVDEVKVFAEQRGLSASNAGVRVFRAREALKRRLLESCGTCAEHGCRNCTCQTGC